MKQWKDLSKETLEVMKDEGDYCLLNHGKGIKGYIGEEQEGQSYMDSHDLRKVAKAFIEVADFLDYNQLKSNNDKR